MVCTADFLFDAAHGYHKQIFWVNGESCSSCCQWPVDDEPWGMSWASLLCHISSELESERERVTFYKNKYRIANKHIWIRHEKLINLSANDSERYRPRKCRRGPNHVHVCCTASWWWDEARNSAFLFVCLRLFVSLLTSYSLPFLTREPNFMT